MWILHISGSHSNVTASGLVLLYEGLGRHNGYMQKMAFPHQSDMEFV